VQGDRVQLDIHSRQDRLAGPDGTVDTQTTATRVSGRLGEWIELGDIRESASGQRSGLLSRQAGSARENRTIRLKVDLLE
jgi:hypothetical protein